MNSWSPVWALSRSAARAGRSHPTARRCHVTRSPRHADHGWPVASRHLTLQRSANILGYWWRAVEIFNPPRPPGPSDWFPTEAKSYACTLRPGEPAPWEPGHRVMGLQLGPGKTWEFTLYCGLYRRSCVEEELSRRFGRDDEYRDSATPGESALFALTVDADGYPVQRSAVLSACAWALGRLADTHGPGWLSRRHQVDEQWLPGTISAQRDRKSVV